MKRPNWQEYFLGLAFLASARSRDSETKHGAVITDKDNIVIGTGYNSFVKNIDDSIFPTTRPNKYSHIIHAEENSIFNCKVPPRELRGGGTIYVTGTPCNNCLRRLIQVGVRDYYIAKRQGSKLESDDEFKRDQQILIEQSGIKWQYMDIDLSWVTELVNSVSK